MENSIHSYNSEYFCILEVGSGLKFISGANEYYMWIQDDCLALKTSLFLSHLSITVKHVRRNFSSGAQNLRNSRYKVALILLLFFSSAKSTYIGKCRLTSIFSIVADGGKKTEASKVCFRLRLCS